MTHDRAGRSSGRIAVVDDDASVRKSLTRLLQASSYEVESFETAGEFIAALDRGTPACALIDLQMPKMTGLELQHYLADAGVSLPTIVMTAHDQPGTRERCIAAGASAYLVKPLRKAALMAAIKAATEMSSRSPS
jgi:FixJ family two-component response regulator